MISYEPPKQEAFGVGDYIDGIGTVLDPDDEEMAAFIEEAVARARMQAVDRRSLERAAKVAQVIAEHPDLPIKVLAPSTPSDYDTYYHDVFGASVKRLLFPHEVMKLYDSHTFYLDEGRTYDDLDEVANEIETWLWDNDHGHEFMGEWQDPLGGKHFIYDEWSAVYAPIARMMAEDMPWHEYIVIDCY